MATANVSRSYFRCQQHAIRGVDFIKQIRAVAERRANGWLIRWWLPIRFRWQWHANEWQFFRWPYTWIWRSCSCQLAELVHLSWWPPVHGQSRWGVHSRSFQFVWTAATGWQRSIQVMFGTHSFRNCTKWYQTLRSTVLGAESASKWLVWPNSRQIYQYSCWSSQGLSEGAFGFVWILP